MKIDCRMKIIIKNIFEISILIESVDEADFFMFSSIAGTRCVAEWKL